MENTMVITIHSVSSIDSSVALYHNYKVKKRQYI